VAINIALRVSVGIFATEGIFATINSVIYIDVHICAYSLHVFFRFGRPPPATVLLYYRLSAYFPCNNKQSFKICMIDVILITTKTIIFTSVSEI